MTKRVLLVEDNAASRRLIGDHLRRAGHDVHEVGSADDALSLAVTQAYDLIIMDIQLPGTDGLTATRLLRANPETCTVPILAVTAHAMRGDEARILSAGCDGYVAKPIAYREMLTKVASLLSRSSQRGA